MIMMKKTSLFVLRATALASMAVALSAHALQTVTPVKDAGGTAFAGGGPAVGNVVSWSTTAGLGTTVTVIGRYSDGSSGNEAGLGLKVKYDETKFTGVTVTALNTKCMIAPPQVQPAGATSQAVMGWIETSKRAGGAVGWPALADLATPDGCLSPNTPANETGAATPTLNLFQFTGTLAPSVGVNGTTDILITADGNFSYAGAGPGMNDQKITITAAPAPLCNLDVDGSGGTPSASIDGLLIKRALNSFLPAANILNGITLPATATRTTGAAIRAYVLGLGNVLDVDTNGANVPAASVDGLLIQRALNTFISSLSITTGVTTAATGSQVRTYLNANCGTSLTP
jgi:hypothetical protein